MSAKPAATAVVAPTAAPRPAPLSAQAHSSTNPDDRRGALLAALADALAGALGSVVAVAVFYPIDIAKTRAQASSAPTSPKHPDHGDYRGKLYCNGEPACSATAMARGSRERRGWFKSRTLAALLSIVRNEGGLTRVYEGIEAKALQALLGSFVYFYAYAFIKGVMRRRAAVGGGGGSGGAPKSLRPSLNLLAAAMAGTVNQAFTLPLENITTRMQTASQHPPQPSKAMATTRVSAEGSSDWTETQGGGAGAGMGQGGSCCGEINDSSGRQVLGTSRLVDCRGGGDGVRDIDRCRDQAPAISAKTQQGEEASDGVNTREEDDVASGRRPRPRQSFAAVTGELYREGGGMRRFWRGFVPSLILTCNPAINYTAFDVLKALWLRRREVAAASVTGTGRPGSGGLGAAEGGGAAQRGAEGFLNPLEAFFVAAAAKSLATVITYPLIRAKVVLMTSRSPPAPTVDGYPVSNAPTLRGGDDGANWASPRRSTKMQHAICGAGGNADGVDDRTFGNGGVGTVGQTATGRGEPEAMGARVAPAVAVAAASEGGRGEEVAGGNARGMGAVLMEIIRREGFGGLYAGCGAQLLHTILKSALLLATKEQIARAAASAVSFGGERGGAAGSTRPRAATG